MSLHEAHMSTQIIVQIIGAPIACQEGVKDSWRDMSRWASGQLQARFGEAVQVQYFDLFDPACPTVPAGAQLPLVLVAGEVFSSGGKLPVPALRRRIESLLENSTK